MFLGDHDPDAELDVVNVIGDEVGFGVNDEIGLADRPAAQFFEMNGRRSISGAACASTIDLAHPAHAEQAGDLERSEGCAG